MRKRHARGNRSFCRPRALRQVAAVVVDTVECDRPGENKWPTRARACAVLSRRAAAAGDRLSEPHDGLEAGRAEETARVVRVALQSAASGSVFAGRDAIRRHAHQHGRDQLHPHVGCCVCWLCRVGCRLVLKRASGPNWICDPRPMRADERTCRPVGVSFGPVLCGAESFSIQLRVDLHSRRAGIRTRATAACTRPA